MHSRTPKPKSAFGFPILRASHSATWPGSSWYHKAQFDSSKREFWFCFCAAAEAEAEAEARRDGDVVGPDFFKKR
jgi:hypothetical protein